MIVAVVIFMPGPLRVLLILLIPLLVVAAVCVPATVLIGTLQYPYRNIAVTAAGLLALLVTMGGYWTWTMDDGLDGLSGEKYEAAKESLSKAQCEDSVDLGVYRRVSASDAGPVVEHRTWWRFPITCDELPRWID